MEKLEERIKAGIQYRSLNLETRKDDGCIVEGYATTFNDPYTLFGWDSDEYREQVDAGAFAEADMDDVIFQYDHQGHVYARIRNKTLTVRPDDKGLFIQADLGGTEEGRKLFEEIKGGYTDRMSFGFTVAEDRWEEWTEETEGRKKRIHLRTITKIGRLVDVSAVSLPANDGTEISARALVDGFRARAAAEAAAAEARERQKQKIRIMLEVTK